MEEIEKTPPWIAFHGISLMVFLAANAILLQQDKPTMVIDAGSLESLDQLYCEARHWLDNYGNKVKLVLLLAIQRDYQKFLLERWQMHEGQPVRVQEFKIAPADCDCGAVDVRPDGMDLCGSLIPPHLCELLEPPLLVTTKRPETLRWRTAIDKNWARLPNMRLHHDASSNRLIIKFVKTGHGIATRQFQEELMKNVSS
ncbi:uncharacterized protein EURHEDRAFT_539311 [Aspergillus ruber CBS 135680]|uniref:Uncharacterized protein n=1 Tax=Aspergillus ruber (strain CBS 135680) TaxID=1388766 RepID=A0A017SB80_ASPRC|nr:uncharacterized protein EURHEDRAFT_539311 [Aspergillus ruber CBS 135680]EYE94192.1 hypothetical protein EURHEDRAFT_539311 [Aspergillus ruber CBS 135680]